LLACAFALLLTALNSVDLPTLGSPTMPACKAINIFWSGNIRQLMLIWGR
jgi:hypothetical protein